MFFLPMRTQNIFMGLMFFSTSLKQYRYDDNQDPKQKRLRAYRSYTPILVTKYLLPSRHRKWLSEGMVKALVYKRCFSWMIHQCLRQSRYYESQICI